MSSVLTLMQPQRRWRVLVLHGPNLNLLGSREPEIYGEATLASIDQSLSQLAEEINTEIECRQSNHEGELIGELHRAGSECDGVVFNPAGYTHTSVALRDAIVAMAKPCVEVHLSNPQARESFRHHSLTAAVCVATVAGFGAASYTLGLRGLIEYLEARTHGHGHRPRPAARPDGSGA